MYRKICKDQLDLPVQAGLLGQGAASLDMPLVDIDANDMASHLGGDGTSWAADSAADVKHAHAFLDADQICQHDLVRGQALLDRVSRLLRAVVELLPPAVFIIGADEVVVVVGHLLPVLLSFESLRLRDVADAGFVGADGLLCGEVPRVFLDAIQETKIVGD
jgi:hypothetical protein